MPPIIQSPHNPQLKHLAKLLSASKHRREHQQAVLEGAHLLSAYLDAGNTPEHVYIPEYRQMQPEIRALIFRLPEHQYTIVSNNLLKKISSLNDADDIMTLIALPQTRQPENSDCIVLERVQDAGNVGTVLRSAAASGIKTIILSEGCADAYSPKVLRAGMGAHFLLHIHERVNLAEWRSHYPHRVLATALTEHNNFSLYDLDLRQPNAWIFGNEGAGISAETLAQANASVKIPMLGATESLNIAMAATICLFEQMRQRL
ncbi:TrmH family RNA methyltransferase [Wielerella bovis]|uniref:TrmH family RNA methyltransferase n=1 Tax=Wielerella bovis TaxID=2917790 RepID=UPI0020187788|nr:RNA methyltransferase [Wielerella bovis]ULJ67682.1 RNA methyltransferase [Wielerella bovis]